MEEYPALRYYLKWMELDIDRKEKALVAAKERFSELKQLLDPPNRSKGLSLGFN